MPDRTHALNTEKVSGGKKNKERVTAMVCANMDGSDKRKLMIIGKSKQPRCMKNVQSLPVTYESNANSWMTSHIYESWLRDFDRDMKLQDRKILLLVDNCPAHPQVADLTNIRLEFLPPNTTSILQPMDMGIISCLKKVYRRQMCGKLIASFDPESTEPINIETLAKSITLLDAITMVDRKSVV